MTDSAVQRLIEGLQRYDPELTATEVAEILWLALAQAGASPAGTTADSPGAAGTSSETPPTDRPDAAATTDADAQAGDGSAGSDGADPGEESGAGIILPPTREDSAPTPGIPVRVPAAFALPGARELARALRPLRRSVYASARIELDIAATVRDTAESWIATANTNRRARIVMPRMRPMRTLWHDIALVVDEGGSMLAWSRTVDELRRMLEYHSAFRDVRAWGLATTASDGIARLYDGQGRHAARREVDPRELRDPAGRRLIILVSDCVAPPWRDGQIARMLESLGQSPFVILQVLPERFWQRTGLGTGTPVVMDATAPGLPNALLDVRHAWGSPLPETAAVTVPVVTLETDPLTAWASMLSGGGMRAVGVRLPLAPPPPPPGRRRPALAGRTTPAEHTAEDRIHGFRLTASRRALTLATLFAAVPELSLPLMHLVRDTMAPDASQVQVAEVLLGGLLREVGSEGDDPDAVRYDFFPGVRDHLLDMAPVTTSAAVFMEVTRRVEQALGSPLDFAAYLQHPQRAGATDQTRAFARVGAAILNRMGGAVLGAPSGAEHGAAAAAGVGPASRTETVGAPRPGDVSISLTIGPAPQADPTHPAHEPVSPDAEPPAEHQPAPEPVVAESPPPDPVVSEDPDGVSIARAAVLMLRLDRPHFDVYVLRMLFDRPDGSPAADLLTGRDVLVELDLMALGVVEYDMHAYGARLTEVLFREDVARQAFAACRSEAQAAGWLLRIQLEISPGASELHQVHWEALHDPMAYGVPLLADRSVLFSRYVVGADSRPARAISARRIRRALIVIPTPVDVDHWEGRVPVDVEEELARARVALWMAGLEIDTLVTRVDDGRRGLVTLEALCARLEDQCDLLYLVAQGGHSSSHGSWIDLQNEEGLVQPIRASELTARLRELVALPKLVLLVPARSDTFDGASPERTRTISALATLAPAFAEAGVPAVVCMTGDVPSDMLATFLAAFLRDLMRHGQVDRAMTAARSAIDTMSEWWMLALYLRVRSGLLWREGGGEATRAEFPWARIVEAVSAGFCVPILGPATSEAIIGSQRARAVRLAQQQGFPIEPAQDDLASVMQAAAEWSGRNISLKMLLDDISEEVSRRLGPTEPFGTTTGSLDERVQVLDAMLRQAAPDEMHRILARLPLPVYITANPDRLLYHALVEAGRSPREIVCRWNDDIGAPYPREFRAPPTTFEPLVYYLFGRYDHPSSLMLTEDDYGRYASVTSARHYAIPEGVQRALSQSSLLFLGFDGDSRDARTVFSSILNMGRQARPDRFGHVLQLIDSDHVADVRAERVQRYYETYFRSHGARVNMDVYWGSSEDLLLDLLDHAPALRARISPV